MSGAERLQVGEIGWQDLTVKDAQGIGGFYRKVVGWESSPQEMGGYSDFNMLAPVSGKTVAGICHARGVNADLPPQWLIYIVVEDLGRSAAKCEELGGAIVAGPRPLAGGRFCVIRDPAGAVCALYEPAQ